MNWLDILKLGGEDLQGGKKLSNDLYDDGESSERVADYFYNQKDRVTTRPHFEQQAKRKFAEEIDGDLQQIADLIGDKGSRNVRYFGFTSDQRDHLITWNIIGKEEIYPKSKKILKPIDLENDNRVIVFDSVYRVKELQKGSINIDGKFMPLFPNDEVEWNNIKQKKTEGRGGSIDIFSNLGEWNKENARLQDKINGAKRAGNTESFEDYKQQIEDHKEKHPRNQKTNNPNKPRRGQGLRFRKSLDWFEVVKNKKSKKHPALKRAGVSGFSKPKRTPDHKSKSHIVVVKDGDKVKTIRFGQKGVKTNQTAGQRKAFKSRHAKNIKRGKTSAAYWANKVKWSPSKTKEKKNKKWRKGS